MIVGELYKVKSKVYLGSGIYAFKGEKIILLYKGPIYIKFIYYWVKTVILYKNKIIHNDVTLNYFDDWFEQC